MVTDGDVLYAGSSNYSGWGLAKRQMQAWQRGFVGFVSEQTQCNLLSRVPELEVLPAAQDFGIGAIIYMPLAGGLLTGKTESLDGSRTRQVEREYGIRIGPENRQFQNFSQLCRELGEPEHVVATAWVLQHPPSLRPSSAFGPSISSLGSIGLPNWSSMAQPCNG